MRSMVRVPSGHNGLVGALAGSGAPPYTHAYGEEPVASKGAGRGEARSPEVSEWEPRAPESPVIKYSTCTRVDCERTSSQNESQGYLPWCGARAAVIFETRVRKGHKRAQISSKPARREGIARSEDLL